MPKTQSIYDKLGRNRPPRVHIGTAVEDLNAIELSEIPYVGGIIADLSGDSKKEKKRLPKRKFQDIDRDNFDQVMDKIEPGLNLRVADMLTGEDNKLNIRLEFRHMEHFSPDGIVNQVPPLKALMEERRRLVNLRDEMDGNYKLEDCLKEIVDNTDLQQKVAEEAELVTKHS